MSFQSHNVDLCEWTLQVFNAIGLDRWNQKTPFVFFILRALRSRRSEEEYRV